ncbi:hypothetical protein [Primorskyibacter sedentarius]|uniref:Uncharacterized protein n=1 Tax=Primorskyibacter sedentarius TaxID=745311 RepID=A0A4R3J459_9RHOB|nr:hypothetical protein [Primorskyibacter sedentarius]TCS59062.1 hypothetical protein EDD52_12221 [Primorskyibacter sedentarius]
MIKQVKSTLHASDATLVQDAVGAVALVIMLVGALHLPGLV